MQRDAGLGEFAHDGGIETAPDFQVADLLFKGLDLVLRLREEHERAAGKTDDVIGPFTLEDDGLGAFRDFRFPDALDEAVQQIDFSGECVRVVIHGFGTAGNIHKSHLLDFFQQSVLLSIQQDEGVFGHGSNHSSEASSSSAWRFLTILEEALERFSSSSM